MINLYNFPLWLVIVMSLCIGAIIGCFFVAVDPIQPVISKMVYPYPKTLFNPVENKVLGSNSFISCVYNEFNITNCLFMSKYHVSGVAGTGSMLPIIQSGSQVFERNLTREEKINATLLAGKIVIYDKNETDGGIIHRCIYVEHNECMMKGDNNVYPDGFINTSRMDYVTEWILTPV